MRLKLVFAALAACCSSDVLAIAAEDFRPPIIGKVIGIKVTFESLATLVAVSLLVLSLDAVRVAIQPSRWLSRVIITVG